MPSELPATRLDFSDPRYWHQNARFAIRDVYDAIVELVTNSDDAYAKRRTRGRIEIEIERRRKGTPSILRVRDFAGGIAYNEIDGKLKRLGDRRSSGLAEGASVRGTNSRGAKDIAVLGRVAFESIDLHTRYVRREITSHGGFNGEGENEAVTDAHRRKLNIPSGGGTLVTVEIDSMYAKGIPQHETMVKKLSLLVPLRDIVQDPDREVYLVDLTQSRRDRVQYHCPEAVERVKEQLKIAGYPQAAAKLVIKRAKRPLENEGRKFREGGILIKSRRAVHEATLIDAGLEHDPHAQFFFGYLRSEYIDDLWNETDDCFEKAVSPPAKNPQPILDPNRQSGMIREHPFTKALFAEALKWLHPLVEEERKRSASQRAQVESEETRRRLNALEKVAARFMDENQEEEEETQDPDSARAAGGLQHRGFGLNPPFAQIVVGHSQRFWLNISQAAYPELAVGDVVQIECASDEISTDRKYCPLETHPRRENILRCIWSVRGERPTPTTGVTARVGAIVGNSVIEVMEFERDRYADLEGLSFAHKRYRATPGTPKTLRLLAPHPSIIAGPTVVKVECADRRVEIAGDRTLHPRELLGIADCKLRVTLPESDMQVRVVATVGAARAETEIVSAPPPGDSIRIKIEEYHHGNQRAAWLGSLLQIDACHPSIKRYLGPKQEGFPGQEKAQFRVLVAEIVAYAVCERVLTRNAIAKADDYRDHDLDMYLADRDELVTKFLPLAHECQVARPE